MKQLTTILAILLLLPLFASAQPKSLDKLFEKYSGKDGFVTVDLSDPSMLSSLAKEDSKKGEIEEAIKGWEAVKILVFEDKEGKNKAVGEAFSNDVKNISDVQGYKDFLSVNKEESYVRMMNKKLDEVRQELLILVVDQNNTVVIWIKGDVDMKDAGKVGELMKSMKK